MTTYIVTDGEQEIEVTEEASRLLNEQGLTMFDSPRTDDATREHPGGRPVLVYFADIDGAEQEVGCPACAPHDDADCGCGVCHGKGWVDAERAWRWLAEDGSGYRVSPPGGLGGNGALLLLAALDSVESAVEKVDHMSQTVPGLAEPFGAIREAMTTLRDAAAAVPGHSATITLHVHTTADEGQSPEEFARWTESALVGALEEMQGEEGPEGLSWDVERRSWR